MVDQVAKHPGRKAWRIGTVLTLAMLAISVSTLGSAGAAVHSTKKPSPPPFTQLEKLLKSEGNQTFKVAYSTHGVTSATSTIVFEQRPPGEFRFSTGDGYVVVFGGNAYECSMTTSSPVCVKTSEGLLSGLEAVFSPLSVIAELKAFQSQAAYKVAGVSVSTTRGTFAGQSSTCIVVAEKAGKFRYCVTNAKGILAYSGSPKGYLEMTAYSGSPPASDFTLPHGAKIVTE
jgi:hypothetical protein